MTNTHLQNRSDLENAQMQEFQQFNADWDQSLSTKEQESQQMLATLDQQHREELERNRAELEQKITQVFKPSSELLNLRKI